MFRVVYKTCRARPICNAVRHPYNAILAARFDSQQSKIFHLDDLHLRQALYQSRDRMQSS